MSLSRRVATRLRHWRDRLNKTDAVQFGLRLALAPLRVRHLSGPRTPAAGADEPIVFCLLRNGMPWLASFLAHHRALGFRHFIMLDNGSDDGTREALRREEGVTLLSTTAPYHAYENTLKRYLVDRYGRGRWCLFVDIDEQFDYPLRAHVPLARLIAYLDGAGCTAMITQMLDMFARRPLHTLGIVGETDLLGIFGTYDLATIRAEPYPFGQARPIRMHWGGIRKAVFGTDNGLTKVSFFRNVAGLAPFVQWHHVKRGQFADLSGVLFHFPFEAGFARKVEEAAQSGRYGYHTTAEYRAYRQRAGDAGFTIASQSALAFRGTDALVEEGFLVISDRYRAFAETADAP